MTPEAILAVLLQRPVYKSDNLPELREAKEAQLKRVADAVFQAAKPPPGVSKADWAALLLTVGEEETHWSLRIGRHECARWECDARRHRDGSVEFMAVGYWQQHQNLHNATVWADMHTQGSELVQAQSANAMLVRGYWTCARSHVPWLQGSINGYAGRRCGDASWRGLAQRTNTWTTIRRGL